MAKSQSVGAVVVDEIDREIMRLESMLKARREHRDAVRALAAHEECASRRRKILSDNVRSAECALAQAIMGPAR